MLAARLLVKGKKGKASELVLGLETRLGRVAENEMILDAPEVSRRHALIRRTEDDEYVLIDLGSANGTFINDKRLVVPTVLSDGDRIVVGPFELTVSLEPDGISRGPALRDETGVTRVARLPGFAKQEERLIGTGAIMAEVFRLAGRAAAESMPVLLEGETGTGKELIARGIHSASPRADQPFVELPCAHLAGEAAAEEMKRQLEGAAGGTVYLDDVAELRVDLQARLMPFLETRKPTVDLRFVASINAGTSAALGSGKLRKDLYYRLATLIIRIPPLRDRREDIPLLAAQMVAAAAEQRGKRITGIDEQALAALIDHDWPGNVRELRNQVERAVFLARDGDRICLRHLDLGREEAIVVRAEPSGQPSPHGESGDLDVASSGREAQNAEGSASTGESASPEYLFHREGEFWTIRYSGRQTHLKDSKGMQYLARLLSAPGSEIHARELAAEPEAEHGGGVARAYAWTDPILSTNSLGDAGPMLDPQAKQEYRKRLAELREELEDAQGDNDPGREARAQAEIDLLTQQIRAAVGLGGRDRPTGSHDERARLLVTQRIKATLRKIAEIHPELSEHLSATIRTGYRCVYALDPAARIVWRI